MIGGSLTASVPRSNRLELVGVPPPAATMIIMPDVTSEHVTVRFAWTPSEYGRAAAAEADLSPRWRTIRWILRGTTGAVVVGSAVFYVASSTPATEVVATMLPWFLLSTFLWQLAARAHRLTPYLMRRQLVGREEERTVSAAGLDVAGALDATFLAWSRVQRVVETEEFVLFIGGPFRTHSIPKRLLGPEGLAALRSLVRKHLPRERVLLAPAVERSG